jgi:hypothetical protein
MSRRLATRPAISASRGLSISISGIAGTFLLHILLITPFFLDLSLPQSQAPKRNARGASAVASLGETAMTVVFINEPASSEHSAPELPDIASRGLAPVDLPLVILSPESLPEEAKSAASPEDEAERAAKPDTAKDQPQRALLYGRYLGQIQARIERAWLRPRTQIGAEKFSCRARIEQNGRGDVVGVDLDHCNGDRRWQQSLLSAIRTASPLPAPPDPSVYADRLWLAFRSDGFRAGSPPDGFEPERAALRIAEPEARQSFEHFANGLDQRFRSRTENDSDVIHLTIIGQESDAQVSSKPEGRSLTPEPTNTTSSPPQ